MEFDAHSMRRLVAMPFYVDQIIGAARDGQLKLKLSFTSKEAAETADEYLQARDFATSTIKPVVERDGMAYEMCVLWT